MGQRVLASGGVSDDVLFLSAAGQAKVTWERSSA